MRDWKRQMRLKNRHKERISHTIALRKARSIIAVIFKSRESRDQFFFVRYTCHGVIQ